MRILGLDIGSNSVGSAWVDTGKQEVTCGVSVFPAGVEETEEGRGAPKNQDRRGKRSLRRSLARRSARKRAVRQLLTKGKLLPENAAELQALLSTDVWELRRAGLERTLSPHEFGRVLLHLCQRRSALGLNLPQNESAADSESDENQQNLKRNKTRTSIKPTRKPKSKAAVERTTKQMKERNARTFGELIALIADERRVPIVDRAGKPKMDHVGQPILYSEPVRNRLDSFEFHADRRMIRNEFEKLWEKQKSLPGALSQLLTASLRQSLDDPQGDDKWRHKGSLFGQRRTYWDTGTLGRCNLEPTDRCVRMADRNASYYRVLETVNNLRIKGPKDRDFRPLNADEHASVMAKLRSQKSGSVPAIRQALKIDKRTLKKQDIPEDAYKLNVAGRGGSGFKWRLVSRGNCLRSRYR